MKKIFSNIPRRIIFLLDLCIVFFSYTLSNFLIYNFTNNFTVRQLIYKLIIVIFVYGFYQLFFGTYKGTVRQTSTKDIQYLFMVNVISFFTLTIFNIILRTYPFKFNFNIKYLTFAYSELAVQLFVATVFMVLARLIYKYLFDLLVGHHKKRKNVIIYGAGNAGVITKNALLADTKSGANVICFIDDDDKKRGKKINGVPIYSSSILTEYFVEKYRIEEAIISIQNIKKKDLLVISERLTKLPIKVKITPAVKDWISGDYNIKQIKQLNIEDLLGRDTINLDNPITEKELEGKVVLITGAAGSIGSEIARQVARKNVNKLVLIDIAESALYDLQQELLEEIDEEKIHFEIANVRNINRLRSIFTLYNPNYIYHAAAYKHVPLMEKFPYEAVNTNIRGTKVLADLAHEFFVHKFVMVSTDKAVNPTNVMGATKRCAEIYVNILNDLSDTNFIVTRFGNVLGSNGSVIPLFKKQLDYGGPLTVTHPDITRYFMTIPEACQLVLEAGAMGKGGEIFVFDMGESMKIIDLAKRMIRLSGYKYPEEIDIKIVGLRPGEKIFEELLANNENTLKTHHEKIMIAKANYSLKNDGLKLIIDLCNYAKDSQKNKDNIALVQKIKEIVPEFKSQNSAFEILDK